MCAHLHTHRHAEQTHTHAYTYTHTSMHPHTHTLIFEDKDFHLAINYFYFVIYFVDYAITVVPFSPPLFPSTLHTPPICLPSALSSHPWVVHISSLASPFPILFLPSPCLFSTYHLCYLFSLPFPLSPPSTPLLIILHVISISVVLSLFELFR